MSTELRGVIAAVVMAAVVLGGTFGISAIVRSSLPQHKRPAPAVQSASASTPGLSGAALQAAVMSGHGSYTANCASCHGTDGVGGYGPNLHNEDMSDTEIASTITNGVKGKMPAFGKKYNAADTQTLIAYIRSLK